MIIRGITKMKPLMVQVGLMVFQDLPWSLMVDTIYTDAGAAGVVGTNYYYIVKAVDALGRKSAESNKVGEFDHSLSNGE
jgi:hypothetical protein